MANTIAVAMRRVFIRMRLNSAETVDLLSKLLAQSECEQSVSCGNRYVLLATYRVTHRARLQAACKLHLPEKLSVPGVERIEVSVGRLLTLQQLQWALPPCASK